MRGKTCLVTGGSRGIGLETARGLAQLGATVFITGRDPNYNARAVEDLKIRTDNTSIDFITADFSALREVKDLAEIFTSNRDALHVLINNAGLWRPKYIPSRDGFELTFAVNYLAPFLLTQLLLPALKSSEPSRIVNVSSRLHKRAKAEELFRLEANERYRGLRCYARSKLALQLFSLELTQRLQGTQVTVNCVHPGDVATEITRESFWARIAMKIARPFLKSPAGGAKTSIHVASAPDLESVSGQYFRNSRAIAPSKDALDTAAAKKLWALSCEMTGLECN